MCYMDGYHISFCSLDSNQSFHIVESMTKHQYHYNQRAQFSQARLNTHCMSHNVYVLHNLSAASDLLIDAASES